jgi:hypothetical protein
VELQVIITRANLRRRIIHVNGFTPNDPRARRFLVPATHGGIPRDSCRSACVDRVPRYANFPQRSRARAYHVSHVPACPRDLRAAILERYAQLDATRPEMFRVLSITEQPPPGFSPDWLVTYVDPGGYLEPYRRLAPTDRENDLVLREATGDRYWLSEYEAKGAPCRFTAH